MAKRSIARQARAATAIGLRWWSSSLFRRGTLPGSMSGAIARSSGQVRRSRRPTPANLMDLANVILVGDQRRSPLPSKWADREIAQPQVGEPALLPCAEERVVEHKAHRIVAAPDRNANTFAEITTVEERTAAKGATILRVGAIEPERERDGVTE